MNFDVIGNHVRKTSQCNPESDDGAFFTYIDISSVDRVAKQIAAPQMIPIKDAPSRARKQVRTNDVIISTVRPNLNTVALVPKRHDGDIASTGFCVLRADEKTLEPKYLFYFSQNKDFILRLTKVATGASYPAVSDTDILESEIPLPPLSEQKRIAAILDKADRLRRQRRYAQTVSDSFLQSVFIKMFGDLITEKRWTLYSLSNVAAIVSGVTKGQKYNGKETVVAPYLRVANVQDGYLNLSEIKTIDALPSEVEALRLETGDILMTEGGDFDKLGRGAIWQGQIQNCIHQNHIFRVRPEKDKLLPTFFASFLLTPFCKRYFLQCSKQTTNLASINMSQLKELPVPIPSLLLQEKFAAIVQKFERIRRQQREATRQAEHLFQTLLHRAFRGELSD